MRRKKHEQRLKEGLDEPCGPPPIAYLSRCAVCGTALLVQEAMIEAGMAMATFRQEYSQGFMPTVGCPGCHGETMEHVEQEE